MAKRELPSPEVLRQLLRYEPETGKLFWKERGPEWFAGWGRGKIGGKSPKWRSDRWNKRYCSIEAGCADVQAGYVRVSIFDQHHYAHRIIWTMCVGNIPAGMEIDHIDGDRSNNRIQNLKLASTADNAKNTRLHSNNTSGVNGVFWNQQRQKWQSQAQVDGRSMHIGFFKSKDAAAQARAAANRSFGFSETHGASDRQAYRVAKS